MPLDHTEPSPPAEFLLATPSSGGRQIGIALATLVVGLLAGFAVGFFIGQSREPISAPRAAAEATYTDAAIEPDPIQEPEVTPDAMQGAPSRGAEPLQNPEPPAPVLVTTPLSGSLLVASRPSGARVFVDGRRVGVTPLSVPGVKAGSHRVRFELPGFRPWTTSVDVHHGERTRVGASLDR